MNVYNLTERYSLDETAYNAMRAEFVAGKGANEIAIALHVTCILSVILRTTHLSIGLNPASDRSDFCNESSLEDFHVPKPLNSKR